MTEDQEETINKLLQNFIRRLQSQYDSSDFNAAVNVFLDISSEVVGRSKHLTNETKDNYKELHQLLRNESANIAGDAKAKSSLLVSVKRFWKVEVANEIIESTVDLTDFKDDLMNELHESIGMARPSLKMVGSK